MKCPLELDIWQQWDWPIESSLTNLTWPKKQTHGKLTHTHLAWQDLLKHVTIQLYCLCVEKFAFWLIIYIPGAKNHSNNRWLCNIKTTQITADYVISQKACSHTTNILIYFSSREHLGCLLTYRHNYDGVTAKKKLLTSLAPEADKGHSSEAWTVHSGDLVFPSGLEGWQCEGLQKNTQQARVQLQ